MTLPCLHRSLCVLLVLLAAQRTVAAFAQRAQAEGSPDVQVQTGHESGSAGSGAFPGRGAALGAPVKLIVDTELGSDVSNLISVCSVNAMMDRGEVDLKAVVTSTGLPEAIGVISAVNHFYGHDGVELGAYKGILGTDEVCSILAAL